MSKHVSNKGNKARPGKRWGRSGVRLGWRKRAIRELYQQAAMLRAAGLTVEGKTDE